MQKRRMTGDVYGVKGFFKSGEVMDHIVAGSIIELRDNDKGQPCVYAYGREYPLYPSLEYDVMRKSEPVREPAAR